MIDKPSDQVAYAVMTFDGFLGLGGCKGRMAYRHTAHRLRHALLRDFGQCAYLLRGHIENDPVAFELELRWHDAHARLTQPEETADVGV